MPYDGVGIMSPQEYAAHVHALRQIKVAESKNGLGLAMLPGADAPIASAEYMASMAIARGGLARQSVDGWFKLTSYGRLYLEQRGG